MKQPALAFAIALIWLVITTLAWGVFHAPRVAAILTILLAASALGRVVWRALR
jgi:hypothetical protein